MRGLHRRRMRADGRNPADHHVGMAAEILGARRDRDVDAVVVRAEIERRRPGVVHDDRAAARMDRARDRRNVLDLEGERAGALDIDGPGVRPHQVRDMRAERGIVIGGLDAELLQHAVAEPAGRLVHGVDHQEVIAGRERREQSERHGRDAGGHERDLVAALEFEQRVGQRVRGRVAAAMVAVGALDRAIVRDRVPQHSRAVDHRRIDEAELLHRVAAREHDLGHRPIGPICALRHALQVPSVPPVDKVHAGRR